MDGEKTTTKARKGWLAVSVGLEHDDGGFRRFTIPISYLYHHRFARLLEDARETYGYQSAGPLKLPCTVDDFVHIRTSIEGEARRCGRRRQHRRSSPFSFRAC